MESPIPSFLLLNLAPRDEPSTAVLGIFMPVASLLPNLDSMDTN